MDEEIVVGFGHDWQIVQPGLMFLQSNDASVMVNIKRKLVRMLLNERAGEELRRFSRMQLAYVLIFVFQSTIIGVTSIDESSNLEVSITHVSRTGQSDLSHDKVTVLAELESGMSIAAGMPAPVCSQYSANLAKSSNSTKHNGPPGQKPPNSSYCPPSLQCLCQEWLVACKGGKPANANFEYGGPLTEVVLLGNVAVRNRKKLLWDAPNMRITNVPEANDLLAREYRPGWDV